MKLENLDISKLTNKEKLDLVELLWDSIDNPDDLFPFNRGHKKLIDERLSKIDKDSNWITLTELKNTLHSTG